MRDIGQLVRERSIFFFFSSRRRHTRCSRDWSSDVCSSDLVVPEFDMPGHSTSWFVGYPELASAPGPYEIERRWGVFDAAMDPTKESTYKFLDRFIEENRKSTRLNSSHGYISYAVFCLKKKKH